MANYKSFVFNSTDDSVPLVTPGGGRYHLYINQSGQIEVINHLGEIIAQSFSTTNTASDITNFFTLTNGETSVYRESGTINGRPRYIKVGGDEVTEICFWADNNPDEWVVYDPGLIYRSTQDVANPTLVTSWTAQGSTYLTRTSELYSGTTQNVLEALAKTVGIVPLVYHALLTQSGIGDPDVVVLENTIGDIFWSRNDAGNYSGFLLDTTLTVGRTSVINGRSMADAAGFDVTSKMADSSTIQVYTIDLSTLSLVDDQLENTVIYVRSY